MKQLRDARGRFTRPILTWGVELEGGFEGRYESDAEARGWVVDYDESVETYAENAELVSPVYDNLDLLKRDLKALYGYIEDINSSMGFHIHIGVLRPIYYLLSSWGFVNFFQNAVVDEFPETRRRLANHFCGAWRGPVARGNSFGGGPDWPRNHTLQMQAEDKYDGNGNDRFKAVNFCYGLHKTIEFRLFPAVDDYYEAFEYLDFVKWAVGEWVAKHDLDPIREGVEEAEAAGNEGEVVVDLGAGEVPTAEPVDLGAHFENVLAPAPSPSPESNSRWGGGRTWAELDGQLVYPHRPGCPACDEVRMNQEARIIEIHAPRPGARLRVAPHMSDNDNEDWSD